MKRIVLSFVIIIFSGCLISNAQIPNSGFESWAAGNPVDWATSNVFEAGLIPITQTSDMHSGTSAVKGEVVNFFNVPMAPIIQSGSDATGFAISEKYRYFELYYKFTSAGGDKFSVNVGLEKNGIAIAQGAVADPTNVGAYMHLSVPLTYMIEDVPDHANIQISITGPVTGPDVHLGSVMFIDDLAFSLETGIDSGLNPDQNEKCFPNPASDLINIPFNKIQGDIVLKVFDIFGKEVKSIGFHSQAYPNSILKLSTAELSDGIYFYSVIGQNDRYTGKFNVSR